MNRFTIILAVLLLGWGGLHLSRRGFAAYQMKQIRSLALVCRAYQTDWDGRNPESLDELYPDYVDTESVLKFKRTFSRREDFIYRAEPFLLASPLLRKGRRLVCEEDGAVQLLTESDFKLLFPASN